MEMVDEKGFQEWLKRNPDLRELNQVGAQDVRDSLDGERVAEPASAAQSLSLVLYEQLLMLQEGGYGIPVVQMEYAPDDFDFGRRRIDVAFPSLRLAVEIEGGIWMSTNQGRSAGHANPTRFLRDMVKYNMLAEHRWFLLRYTPAQVKDGTAVTEILHVIQSWQQK